MYLQIFIMETLLNENEPHFQPGWEGEFGGETIQVYVGLSPFAVYL